MNDDTCTELEGFRPYAQSLLWELQARFYRERGVQAWREDEVPHYVTNNPVIAGSYAEVVFAALLDLRRLGRYPAGQPLHICELGAGTGRFAFHFLRRLSSLCESAGLGHGAFRYVLTDQAEPNLDFWRGHPQLQKFFRSEVLDLARFDALQAGELRLQRSGAALGSGALQLPVVVIANYVFDTLPQELLYIDGGQAQECQVALSAASSPAGMDAGKLLGALQYRFRNRPLDRAGYEPPLRRLIDGYRAALQATHLALPVAALRCLERLAALSAQGLVLLSADKGDHRLTSLQGRPPPRPVHHGSISLNVNYHAIKAWCEQRGGLALFPRHPHRSLDIGVCLAVRDASAWQETHRACERHLGGFGPDDFFTVSKHVHMTLGRMSTQELLAYLRLSRHDAHQCARYIPRLRELVPSFTRLEHTAVVQALEEVWAGYYPIGEDIELAALMAGLLYRMGEYETALVFLARSQQHRGADSTCAVNMASCHYVLGRRGAARGLLEGVLRRDPGCEAAHSLLARMGAASPAVASAA